MRRRDVSFAVAAVSLLVGYALAASTTSAADQTRGVQVLALAGLLAAGGGGLIVWRWKKTHDVLDSLAFPLGVFLLHVLGGTASFLYLSVFSRSASEDLVPPLLLALLAVTAMTVGWAVVTVFPGLERPAAPSGKIDWPSVNVVAWGLLALGAVAFWFLFAQKGSPLAVADVNATRVALPQGQAMVFFLGLQCATGLAFAGSAFLARRAEGKANHQLFLVQMLVGLIPLVMLSTRFFVVQPFLVAAANYNHYVKRLSLRAVTVIAIVLLVGSMVAGYSREYSEESLATSEMGVALAKSTFSEMRILARVMDVVPSGYPYLYGKTYIAGIASLFPAGVLESLGFSKMALLVGIGEYTKRMLGLVFAGGGVRILLLGELYVNLGPTGVAVGFLIWGALFGLIGRRIRTTPKDSPQGLMWCGLLAYLVWLATTGFSSLLPIMMLYFVPAYAVCIFCRRGLSGSTAQESVDGVQGDGGGS